MVNAIFIVIGLAILALIGWLAKGFFTEAEIPLVFRILVGIIAISMFMPLFDLTAMTQGGGV